MMPSGTPTAEQEALQAPTVDPIVTLANGVMFGPLAASKGLLADILLAATGGWLSKGNAAQYTAPTGVVNQAANSVEKEGYNRMLRAIFEDSSLTPAQKMEKLMNTNALSTYEYSFHPRWRDTYRTALEGWRMYRHPGWFPESVGPEIESLMPK